MPTLIVEIDPADSRRLIFNIPVTLSQAMAHLWSRPPAPGALRPDPSEQAPGGCQRRFLINKEDLNTVLSLRHGLADQYLKRIQPIAAKGKPPPLPAWVPADVQKKIVGRQLAAGVHRFPGMKPFGNIVVWIASTGYAQAQVYQEFPDSLDYYKDIAKGNAYDARLLHKVYTQFNSDMRYFVEKKGWSPEAARDEIARIGEECFKLILEGMAMIMTAGAGISAIGTSMRNTAPRMIASVKRSGFRRGGIEPGAGITASGASAYRNALAEAKINGRFLTETEIENAMRSSELVKREVAQASAGKMSSSYIPAGVADTVDGLSEMTGSLIPSKPFQFSGAAYNIPKAGRIVVSKDAVAGTTLRGSPQSLRVIVRHEVGEVLESGPQALWSRFGDIGSSHWRSSARGATLPGTTRAEQITLLRDAKALAQGSGGSLLRDALDEIRKVARKLTMEREVF